MKRRTLLTLTGTATLAVAAPAYWTSRWRYITIHHSGGGFGDVALLRRVHRERQPHDPVDAIPYHFLIGNGNGLRLGEIVETERWRLGLWGAHVSAGNSDRNLRGIGICLIGNFQTDEVPDAQLEAAITLSRDLMQRYRIPDEGLNLHGHTPGESTLCPGRNFPRDRFFQAVRSA